MLSIYFIFTKSLKISLFKTFYHYFKERGNVSHRNRQHLQPPSSGISSLGLHSYAGKASYVGNSDTDGSVSKLSSSSNQCNVAIVRPRPTQRNPSISSTTVETGDPLPPVKRPRVRKWYNLYGVIDTEKLGNLFGRSKYIF